MLIKGPPRGRYLRQRDGKNKIVQEMFKAQRTQTRKARAAATTRVAHIWQVQMRLRPMVRGEREEERIECMDCVLRAGGSPHHPVPRILSSLLEFCSWGVKTGSRLLERQVQMQESGRREGGRMLLMVMARAVLVLGALGSLWGAGAVARDEPQVALLSAQNQRPNIVLFLTDDQDVHLDSLAYQPWVRHHLIEKGLTFRRHFCTVALCCPSRVNLWTGKAAHNTNVTDVNPPYGKSACKVDMTLSVSWLMRFDRRIP